MRDIIAMSDIIIKKIKTASSLLQRDFSFIFSPPLLRGVYLSNKDLSLSISRVLSCTVIYLDLSSPISSSDIHGIPSDGQPY